MKITTGGKPRKQMTKDEQIADLRKLCSIIEQENIKLREQVKNNLSGIDGSYSITFGKHLKAKIQIENSVLKVEAAMNGWGDGISLSDITIEKLQ